MENKTNNGISQLKTQQAGQGRKSRLERLNPDTTPDTERRKMTDTEMIKSWIDAGQSVLLRGPSGIGKTERIKKLYPDLIYIKLTNNMFPEKVVGSMNLQTGQAIPPDFAKHALLSCATDEEKKLIQENVQNLYELADTIYERSKTAEGKVVILLDELLNVKPAVQSLVYTLVLNKIVETGKGLKLPANTVVVATGNQKKYSSVAEDLAEPLEKRFDHILDMEPRVSEWIYEYAIPEKVHPTVIGYIFSKFQQKRCSEKLENIGYFYEEPEVGETHLDKNGCRGRTNDPRGWVSISNTLYAFEEDLKNGNFVGKDVEALLKASLASKLRDEWAKEFFDFYNHPTLSVEDVVAKRYAQADLPRNINDKFATMAGLLSADLEQVAVCRDFIRKHCDPEYLSVYDIYWAGTDEKRMEKLAELWELDKASQLEEKSTKPIEEKSTKPKDYKITIGEFFASYKLLAIATPTEEQAKILCRVFDKMGKKWLFGKSYLEETNWNDKKEETAYSNHGNHGSSKFYLKEGVPVYSFDEVDMEKYLDKEPVKTSEEIKPKAIESETAKTSRYKITIDEFCASYKKLAIATPTEEQAKILCRVFDKMGKKWCDGKSYLDGTNWNNHKEETAYSNDGEYCTSSVFVRVTGTPVYSFDEVDMEKYLDEEPVKTSEEIKPKAIESEAPKDGKYKITIDEFFATDKELAIATPTLKQAKTLLKVFDKMGKKWRNGNSYLRKINWIDNLEETAYSNRGQYGTKRFYSDKATPVYSFDEVDMEKYLDEESVKEEPVKIDESEPVKDSRYKITIDEFFAVDKELAIATPTFKQAKALCKVFDKMGKKWSNGESYLWVINWNANREETAYSNRGTYGSSGSYSAMKRTPVYDFDEVDMEKYLDEEVEDSRYKITIDEFFASDKELAIATPTLKQARTLLKVFDKMGKLWYKGKSFANTTWPNNRENTAYSNQSHYSSSSFYLKQRVPVYDFDEVDMEKYLDEDMKYEITIDEFFASDKYLAITATTEKQAQILCKVFDRMGKKWADGDSYLETTRWDKYAEQSVYTNENTYSVKGFGIDDPKLFDFDDVDMEKYLDEESKKIIEESNAIEDKVTKGGRYKITIDEFFASYKILAIATPIIEQAKILCKVFNKMGKEWRYGGSYKKTEWDTNAEKTTYTNTRAYGERRNIEGLSATIYEFNDVDMEKYLDRRDKKKIASLAMEKYSDGEDKKRVSSGDDREAGE